MRLRKILFILCSLSIFVIPSINAEEFDIYSNNAILYNITENKIIYEKNSDEKAAIASLTKLMTALVVTDNIDNYKEKIDLKLANYDYLYKTNLALSSLNHKKSYTYDDVLYDFLMESSADCGYALAISVAGNEKEFVKMMNDKAKELGMNNTSYANPVGRDNKNNYSTMNDMLILMKTIMNNKKLKEIISTFKYITNEKDKVYHTIYSYIKRYDLNMPYLKGGKTGHEGKPGYALASYAEMNDCSYILITTNANDKLGIPTHFLDAKKIYEYYFNNYGYQTIISKNDVIKKLKTNGLKEKSINVKPSEDIVYYLNNKYNKDDIKLKYYGKEKINFLSKKGDKLGKVDIFYQNKKINTIYLTLNQKIHFNLNNFIKDNKYLIIAIICYIIIALSTVLAVLKIKHNARKKVN